MSGTRMQKLSTIAFRWYFIGIILRTCPWHPQQTENEKLPVITRCLPSFIFFKGWLKMLEQTTWWHHAKKKPAACFYDIYRSIFKKCARSGSVLWATCVLLKIYIFPQPAVSKFLSFPLSILYIVFYPICLRSWLWCHIQVRLYCHIISTFSGVQSY